MIKVVELSCCLKVDFLLFCIICEPIDPVKGCEASVFIFNASDFLNIVFGFAYLVLTGVADPGAVNLLLYNDAGVFSSALLFYF